MISSASTEMPTVNPRAFWPRTQYPAPGMIQAQSAVVAGETE